MIGVLDHDSALSCYNGLELPGRMRWILSGSIARPVAQQSSALPLSDGCLPMTEMSRTIIRSRMYVKWNGVHCETSKYFSRILKSNLTTKNVVVLFQLFHHSSSRLIITAHIFKSIGYRGKCIILSPHSSNIWVIKGFPTADRPTYYDPCHNSSSYNWSPNMWVIKFLPTADALWVWYEP